MFKNTIAVGPLDPAAFCVTGGACTEARHLEGTMVDGRARLLESLVAEVRNAMVMCVREEEKLTQ